MITRNRPSTIYDVARQSGLSITTVSRCLNNPEKVNAETRQRVLKAIEDLGFVPKAEARARALRSTGRVGVITPFFTAPSFVQRLRGIAAVLSAHNCELVVYTVGNQEQLEGYLNAFPLTRNLDGVIVLSLQFRPEQIEQIYQAGMEAVFIEYNPAECSSVEIDNVAGGRIAGNYLIQQGHRRMAFMGEGDGFLPVCGIDPISPRLSGFRQALEEAGLSLPPEYVRLVTYSFEHAKNAALELLRLPERPTAIFAATDLQAIGVLRAAIELGLHAPQDVAIVGFDDLDVAEYVELTTVRQPLDESGRVAAELLLARLSDPGRPIQHVSLPLMLVQRATA